MAITDIDLAYLRHCIHIASRSGKSVRSNPHVGAIIVAEQRIIGESVHEEFGKAHAEINALSSVAKADQHLLPSSTIYVSLEPCNHVGKTGACSNAILKAKIKRVVIAAKDTNPHVSGGGIAYLRSHGVTVELHELDQADSLLKAFKYNNDKQLPYTILKFAQSADYFIAKEGEQTQLSNSYTQVLTHKWRSEVDAILIGKNTAQIDNPRLDTRAFPGSSPQRIVLASKDDLNTSSHLLQGEPACWFYPKPQDLLELLHELYAKGICRLLVEGGAEVLSSFIKADLWNEARVISTTYKLGNGVKAPTIQGQCIDTLTIADDRIHIIVPKQNA